MVPTFPDISEKEFGSFTGTVPLIDSTYALVSTKDYLFGQRENHIPFLAMNYYAVEVNSLKGKSPIEIIICTDNGSLAKEYAISGIINNIFASRYVP